MLRVLVFDAGAQRNLAEAKQPDMNLFNWFTSTSQIMLYNINTLIAKAERERAEEYGAA